MPHGLLDPREIRFMPQLGFMDFFIAYADDPDRC